MQIVNVLINQGIKTMQNTENNQANTEEVDVNVENQEDNTDVENQEVAEEVSSEQAEIDALTAEVADLKDQYLRASAEMDNIRKRARQESDNAKKYAISGFANELLAVKDSLDLATKVELNDDSTDAEKSMREGLELTLKQLMQAFEKFNVVEINPEPGEKLNPELHQAMAMQPSDEFEPNSILTVFQKGYSLSGRLLRPAMVVVSQKAN